MIAPNPFLPLPGQAPDVYVEGIGWVTAQAFVGGPVPDPEPPVPCPSDGCIYMIDTDNPWGLCNDCALLKQDDMERRRWNRAHGIPWRETEAGM